MTSINPTKRTGLFIDRTGTKIAHLTFIRYVGKHKWECRCDCGVVKSIQACSIVSGSTISCGCIGRTNAIKNLEKGWRAPRSPVGNNRVYQVYASMIRRCYRSENQNFKHYGGRGIKVCDRWIGREGFVNFLRDMGEPPSGMSIDRIDNDGPYSPENCRWATAREQNNNKRNTVRFTFNGETKTIRDWHIETGIKHSVLYNRIMRKWKPEDVIEKPVRV